MATLFSPLPKDRPFYQDTPTPPLNNGQQQLLGLPRDNEQKPDADNVDVVDPSSTVPEERATQADNLVDSRDTDRLIQGSSQPDDAR